MTEKIPEPYTQEFLDHVGVEGIARLSADPVVLKIFAYWYGEWSQGSTHAGWTEEELRAEALQTTWSEAAREFYRLSRYEDADIAATIAYAMFYFWEEPALRSALRKANEYLRTHNIDGTPMEK